MVLNRQSKLYRWHVIVDIVPTGDTPLIGAEVGVWRGECSDYLLGMLPNLTLYMVDRWRPADPGDPYHESGDSKAVTTQDEHDEARREAEAVARTHDPRGLILALDSIAASRIIDEGSLDFVFLDGDHTRAGVEADIAAWLPKVKSGGVLAGHDYSRYGVSD